MGLQLNIVHTEYLVGEHPCHVRASLLGAPTKIKGGSLHSLLGRRARLMEDEEPLLAISSHPTGIILTGRLVERRLISLRGDSHVNLGDGHVHLSGSAWQDGGH